MDIQDFIRASIAKKRKDNLSKSDQLTLGEILLKCEAIIFNHKDDKEQPTVTYDFDYFYPTSLHSWRGSYDEISLNIEDGDLPSLDIVEFTSLIKSAIGATFEGWKGGDFTMNKNTPVWVSKPQNSGNTAVIDIIDNSWQVVIMTAYREY